MTFPELSPLTKAFSKFLLWIAGAGLYVWLFYQQGAGLNVLAFSLMSIAFAAWSFPHLLREAASRRLAGAVVLSALFVVWRHTGLSISVYALCFLLFTGHLHARPIRFLWFAGLLGLSKLLGSPLTGLRELISLWKAPRWQAARQWVPYAWLPAGLGAAFTVIYYQANPKFASFLVRFWPGYWLQLNWEPLQVVCFVMGVFVVGGLLWPSIWSAPLQTLAYRFQPYLSRYPKHPGRGTGTLSLKRAYQSSLFTLAMLNALLFVANLTDLRYVWVNYGQASPQELSQYVHEGTYLLALSVVLAIGVLLYLFRGNLNFYPDNERLKWLSHLWLAQNTMLVLSVGLRNWQYVAQYGLAYKRLGVFGFLVVTLTGLWLVYAKTRELHTIAHFFKKQAEVLLVFLLLAASMPWGQLITRYNIRHAPAGELDTHFLVEVILPTNLPVLLEERGRLKEAAGWPEEELERQLRRVSRRLQYRYRPGWRSWNAAAYRARRADPFRQEK